jgi:predicted small secreted protein
MLCVEAAMKRTIGVALCVVLCALWLSGCGAAPGVDDNIQNAPSVVESQPAGSDATNAERVDKSGLRLAPEIQSEQWLNGAPVTLHDLRGQVVVLDFWTFD